MGYRKRIHYTEADKALMWERWRRGESLNSIGRLFGRHHTTVQGMLARTGGIRPPPRRRSRLALTLAEREEISRGLMAGLSVRRIAASLGRAASTVSREIDRNGGRQAYRAGTADEATWDRTRRPKHCKLAAHPALARLVAHKLQLEWSPRQIAGWLKRAYPDHESRQVSHETIYRTLFIQARVDALIEFGWPLENPPTSFGGQAQARCSQYQADALQRRCKELASDFGISRPAILGGRPRPRH